MSLSLLVHHVAPALVEQLRIAAYAAIALFAAGALIDRWRGDADEGRVGEPRTSGG